MRVTIIRETNTVNVDGLAFEVGAVALIDKTIHAVQWDGAAVRGEIEYSYIVCMGCGVGSKKPNATFTDFAPYQPLVDAWSVAKAAHEAEQARIAAEHEAAMNDEAQRRAAEPQA